MSVETELKDLKEPAMVAAAVVGASFLLRKLTSSSVGVEAHNFSGAAKAFEMITLAGGAVNWYLKKPQPS